MRITSSCALIASMQFGISGPLDCHVYALRGPRGIVLVDAGSGTHSDTLLANLHFDLGTDKIQSLIVTHGHLDHCGGAASIAEKTQCKVVTTENTRPILESADEEASGLRLARSQGVYPPEFRFTPCKVNQVAKDGVEFEAGGLSWKAIRVRGHSEDSACFLVRHDGQTLLFSADVIFYGGVLGVINAEGSGMGGYRADLRKLANLGIDGLFPGHGLFTMRNGQRHIDTAIEQVARGFVPRQIGQGDLIF
jgi:glyoxylase-like metal-dependent hydrolase (beta-lactamase superfamily II)